MYNAIIKNIALSNLDSFHSINAQMTAYFIWESTNTLLNALSVLSLVTEYVQRRIVERAVNILVLIFLKMGKLTSNYTIVQ
jgi:hypothetical protein